MSYDLESGNQIAAGIVDVVVEFDDRSDLFDCMKACSVADLVGGHCLLGQKLLPRRRGRLAGVWRPVSPSTCPRAT
jgi:hypothetical protein